MTDRICVAEIITAHGIRGAVKLRSYCEDLDLIDGSGPLFTGPTGDRALSLTLGREIGPDMFLADVENISDRTAAEKLRGTKLYLARDLMPKIEEAGTFYHFDLVNLPVFDNAGAPRGHIVSVQNFGAGDLLEIKPETGAPSYYLPFNDIYVPQVDIAAKRVTIEPTDELINPK